MLAIILAGGEGKRLRPLTNDLPKPLIPVQGKTLVELVVDVLRRHGVDELILSVGYRAEQIQAYFREHPLGLPVRFLVEAQPRGTAGALMMLKESGELPTDDFFMVNADNLLGADLGAFAAFHRSHGGLVTVALHEVEDPSAYGVARMEGERIVEFVEKPPRGQAPSHLINTGYSMLSPRVFAVVPNQPFAMYERDVYPAVAKSGMLFGYPTQGQWFDTGTHESYARVQTEWQGP